MITSASSPDWLPAVVPPDLQGRTEVDALLAGESTGRRRHLAADQRAARVPGDPGVRPSVPAGPHPGADPDRRRRGRPRGPRDGSPALARGPDGHRPGGPADRPAAPEDGFIVLHPGHPGAAPDERRHPAPLAGGLDQARGHQAVGHDLGQPARRHARVPHVQPHQAGRVRAHVPARPAQGAHRVRSWRAPRQGWYTDWTARCLGIPRDVAAPYVPRLLSAARGRGRARRPRRRGRRHPRLRAAARPRQVRLLDDATSSGARPSAATPATGSRSCPRSAAPTGRASTCPRYGCTGTLTALERRHPRPSRRLLPRPLHPRAALQGRHRRARRRDDPRPAGAGRARLPRWHPLQRPERAVLHAHP